MSTPDETNPAPEAPAAKVLDPAEILRRACMAAWKEATDRETPTLLQLLQSGSVKRVDVDAIAGYLAVQTGEDTHRAIGVRREMVAPLVATLTGRAVDEVTALLARGPQKLEARTALKDEAPSPAPAADEDAPAEE
jgi:hypothetical protein